MSMFETNPIFPHDYSTCPSDTFLAVNKLLPLQALQPESAKVSNQTNPAIFSPLRFSSSPAYFKLEIP